MTRTTQLAETLAPFLGPDGMESHRSGPKSAGLVKSSAGRVPASHATSPSLSLPVTGRARARRPARAVQHIGGQAAGRVPPSAPRPCPSQGAGRGSRRPAGPLSCFSQSIPGSSVISFADSCRVPRPTREQPGTRRPAVRRQEGPLGVGWSLTGHLQAVRGGVIRPSMQLERRLGAGQGYLGKPSPWELGQTRGTGLQGCPLAPTAEQG